MNTLITELRKSAAMLQLPYVEPGRLLAATLTDAADALESAAVREQRLRAALEQAVALLQSYEKHGSISYNAVSVLLTCKKALAGDALPAAQERSR